MSTVKSFAKKIKQLLYFFVADYFAFFARFVLRRWRPTIVTVIGSSGKTTLLHLLESQLKEKAVYSHKANSAFGIPFHILGLERKTFSVLEWPTLLLLAPFKIFRTLPSQKIYVTEADAERPGEGQLLAKLLRPNVLIWLSLGETHGVNFDRLVTGNDKVEQVIAHEFGHFLSTTQKVAIINQDNVYIAAEAQRCQADLIRLHGSDILGAEVKTNSVIFKTSTGEYTVPKLVPKDVGLSVLAVAEVLKYLKEPIDANFSGFTLPPSRSSVFQGKKQTTLIDSTYNATIDGMTTMLELFKLYPVTQGSKKILVLGDMIEQGKSEAAEHERLAGLIQKVSADKVVLVGPRLAKYTFPLLPKDGGVVSFQMPAQALAYLEANLTGGETILFKGARFLEGVVEKLLENPKDADKLCRRETIWVARRKQWGI